MFFSFVYCQKITPETHDETLFKFPFHICGDSRNLIYVAQVKNRNFKNCNFRVLKGILKG